MKRLKVEVLIPSQGVEQVPTRVHGLLTREGYVVRGIDIEEIDWEEGLDILRDTLERSVPVKIEKPPVIR